MPGRVFAAVALVTGALLIKPRACSGFIGGVVWSLRMPFAESPKEERHCFTKRTFWFRLAGVGGR